MKRSKFTKMRAEKKNRDPTRTGFEWGKRRGRIKVNNCEEKRSIMTQMHRKTLNIHS